MFLKRIILIFLLTIPLRVAWSDECGNFNLYSSSYVGLKVTPNGWTSYGNFIHAGGLFTPVFSAGLVAQYVSSAGQTAVYSLPSSVRVAASNASSYYTMAVLHGGPFDWGGQTIDGGASRGVIRLDANGWQKANKSGQNCVATVNVTPLKGTSTQNIGGISVIVGLQGGQTVSVRGTASTVTPMTTLQLGGVSMAMNMPAVQLDLSTAGVIQITVPEGMPDGDYTGNIQIPYAVNACGGDYVCNDDKRIWKHIKTETSNISAMIRIRVVNGKPVNPDTFCTASGNSLNIEHGALNPAMVNDNMKSNSIIITCNGGEAVPVKLTLNISAPPHTGPQLTGNKGILVPLTNGIDSLLSFEGVTEKTVNVSGLSSVKVNSQLKTGGGVMVPGKFTGSAVATINYQ